MKTTEIIICRTCSGTGKRKVMYAYESEDIICSSCKGKGRLVKITEIIPMED